MNVQPYLFFNGHAEEAATFYASAIGAEVGMMMRFGACPEKDASPAPDDKIMHMELRIGETTILGSDGMCSGTASFEGMALALHAKDAAEARRLYDRLGEGGEVQMEMAETFFAHAFGMVKDRFGVSWMVLAAKEP